MSANPNEAGAGRQQWFELADKRPIALSPPPNKVFADQYTGPVATAVSTLQEFVQGAMAANTDATLSDLGKEQRVAPLAAKAVKDLHTLHNTLMARGGKLLQQRQSLFAVPAVEPGNAVQQLADREAREWFRGLSGEARAEVLAQMTGGKLPKVAQALLRSPVPLTVDEKLVRQSWEAAVAAERVGDLTDIDQEQETIDWAALTVSRCAEKLAASPGLNPAKVGAILKQMGADGEGPFRNTSFVPVIPPKA